MPDTDEGYGSMRKMTKLLLVFWGSVFTVIFLISCNANQNRSQEQSYEDSSSGQTETGGSDIANHYDKIKKMCDKMSEEGQAFVEKANKVDVNHFVSAYNALTDSYHHANLISNSLNAIKEGDNVTANLQNIDDHCYSCENMCKDGLEELQVDDESVGADMRQAWSAVLNRIINYSTAIREEVQQIREAL